MTESAWLETLEAYDGVELYCQHVPSPEARGVIVTLHDYALHSGVMQKAHAQLARQGYAIYTLDLRGHGRSPGERAAVDRFDDFLDDLDLLLARVRDRERGHPLFLFGQGLGAAIATRYCLTRRPQIYGLILLGNLPELPTSGREKLAAQYVPILLSHMKAQADAEAQLLEASRGVKEDELVFRGAVRAQTVHELNLARASLLQGSGFLGFPLLTLCAERELRPVEALHEALLSHDKTLHPYAAERSSTLLQAFPEQVLGDIVEWCDARLTLETLDGEDDEDEDEDDSL